MLMRLILGLSLAVVVCCAVVTAAEPEDYLSGDALAGRLDLSNVQTGGFAGLLSTSVTVETDGSWEGERKIGARGNKFEGKLTADQIKALAAELEKLDLLGLPATIGSKKPVKSPINIADGASTTTKLTFGKKTITANFADGVQVDEQTQKLRQRLGQIETAIRRATLDAPK